MALSALQANQLGAAFAAATENFSPGETPQTRFAKNLQSSAQQTIDAENRKKLAKKANKKDTLGQVMGVASMIPGPQQPFVMGANALYQGTQGNVAGAIGSAAGAAGGFAGQYGGGGVVPGTPDPGYAPPGTVQVTPLAAPPAANIAATPAAPTAPGAPTTAPAASMPLDANNQAMLGPTVSAPAAAPAGPTPGSMARGIVSAAAPVAGAAIGAAAANAAPQPNPAPAAATLPGSTATFNDPRQAHNLTAAFPNLTRSQIANNPELLPNYLAAYKASGQAIPVKAWANVPHRYRAQYSSDPNYAGIIPSRSQLAMHYLAPLIGMGAGAYAGSRLEQGSDGVYNYSPGG